MSGFDDLFGDITFPDVKIDLTGQGQSSDSPTDNGQSADSQPAGDQGAKVPEQKTATTPEDDKGKQSSDNALPFDKHPKWQKARAAEKTLNELMETHGYLDVDELIADLTSGKSLKESLKDHDVEDLLTSKKAYEDWKTRMESLDDDDNNDDDQENNGDNKDPLNKKMAQLVEENRMLAGRLEEISEAEHSKEADARAMQNYTSDVDKLLDLTAEEFPLSDVERTLFRMTMGIDNPSTEVNIDDRQAVRSMVKNSVKQFHTAIQHLRQKTIDDYAAGKLKMQVSSSSQSGDTGVTTIDKRNYDLDKQSVDQVLDSGKNELMEIISKGLLAAR